MWQGNLFPQPCLTGARGWTQETNLVNIEIVIINVIVYGISVCQYSWSKDENSPPLAGTVLVLGPYSNLLEPVQPASIQCYPRTIL
ncbi:Protein farnesyltransferase subunit beta [Quillaja saponaria]|uniref:Protein farnesyltransferase subunit beta n=1 Tax=Quillaja saponaria TaxID=32244 RepID=A0AAD7PX88_QUISA|nr:Protein farnesyltransferase subunit beta [Quillaja saponaria]